MTYTFRLLRSRVEKQKYCQNFMDIHIKLIEKLFSNMNIANNGMKMHFEKYIKRSVNVSIPEDKCGIRNKLNFVD